MPSYHTIDLTTFWESITLDGSGCWIWQGKCTDHGHGQFHGMFSHRLAWELEHDEPIPSGKHVCHRCDNPPCVNPSHLFLGDHRENMHDRQRKGRAVCHVSTLDSFVSQLDSMRKFGASSDQIEKRASELLGIDPMTLSALRDVWDHHDPEWPEGGVKFAIGKLPGGGRFIPVDKGPLDDL